MKSPAARGRGRPPKPEGALTPAERKRAQRDRDRATLYGTAVIDTMTLDGLLAGVQHALAEGQVATLATVLKELGRRGGPLGVLAQAGCGAKA